MQCGLNGQLIKTKQKKKNKNKQITDRTEQPPKNHSSVLLHTTITTTPNYYKLSTVCYDDEIKRKYTICIHKITAFNETRLDLCHVNTSEGWLVLEVSSIEMMMKSF